MLIDMKMKKKSVAELDHKAVSKFTSTLKALTTTHAFKSLSPKWLSIFG